MEFNSRFEGLFNRETLDKSDVFIRRDSTITLKETARSSQMEVEIDGVHGDAVVIRLAGNSTVRPASALHDDFKKICDYIILTHIDGNFYAIFIELKTTLNEEETPYEQLFRSRPLLDYFLSVYKFEYEEVPILETRYILIYEKISKRMHKEGINPGLSWGMPWKHKTITVKRFPAPRVNISNCI